MVRLVRRGGQLGAGGARVRGRGQHGRRARQQRRLAQERARRQALVQRRRVGQAAVAESLAAERRVHRARRHRRRLHLHGRVPLVQQLRVQPHELRVRGRRVAGQGRAREQRPLEAGQPGAAVERGPPPQLARRAADEHIFGRGVQHPVVALAGVVVVARHFHKALVQTEVMADRVLPSLAVLPVVREVGHDVLVDAVECEPLLGAVADGHHDESIVAVGGLLVFLVLFVIVVFGFGAVDWLSAGHVQLRVAEVGLGVRGACRRGRG